MGAYNLVLTFPGNKTIAEIEKLLDEIRQQDGHESGHGGYSGNWTTIPKIKFSNTKLFESIREAEDFCLENSEKWSHGCAAKARQTETVYTKKPTFGGKEAKTVPHDPEPIAIELIDLMDDDDRISKWIIADQMTENQNKRYWVLRNEMNKLKCSFIELRDKVTRCNNIIDQNMRAFNRAECNPDRKIELQTFDEWNDYKKNYNAAIKLAIKYRVAKDKFYGYKKRMQDKLYDGKVVEKDQIWVVAGWAAS